VTAMDVALLGVSATTAHIMRHSLRGVTRGVTDRALGQVPVVMRVGARQRGSVRDYATFLRCFARSLVTESVYLIGVRWAHLTMRDIMSARKELSATDAQRILMRAAEIDAQGTDRLSANTLRDAAAAAGIAPEAFDAALREHDQSTAQKAVARSNRRRLLSRLATGASVLFLVYALLFLLPWPWNTTPHFQSTVAGKPGPK